MQSAIRTLNASLQSALAEPALPTFKAWRVRDTETPTPLDLLGPITSAKEALDAAAVRCDHKDHLTLLETHPITGKQTLRVYVIKRESQVKWRRDPITGETVAMARLYPVLLFSMAVDAFAPVEPWKWEPGCDVVGVDRREVRHA